MYSHYKANNIIVWLQTIFIITLIFAGNKGILGYSSEKLALVSIFAIISCKFSFSVKKNYLEIRYHYFFIIILAYLCINYQICYSKDAMQPFMVRFIFITLLLFFHYNVDYLIDLCKYCRVFIMFTITIFMISYPSMGVSGGIYSNYQYTALNLSVGCGFFLPYLFLKEGWNKKTLFQVLIIILGILMTGKRTFFVIPILMILIIGLMSDDHQKYKKLFIVLLCGCLGLIFISLSMPKLLNSIERLLNTFTDSSFNSRKYFWKYAIDIWKENKLFGIGFGCYVNHISTAGVNLSNYGYIRAYAAHNIYYQLLAETGVIGLFLFIGLFTSGIISTIKNIREVKKINNNKLLYLSLVSIYLQVWFVVYGFTGNGLYMSGQLFAYVFGVICNISVQHEINNMKALYNV